MRGKLLSRALFLAALLGVLPAFLLAGEAAPAAVQGHKEWVTSMDFSPDGRVLATAGGEPLVIRSGTLRLWDPSSGRERQVEKGHRGPVWCVRFSPDGKTLATAGYDKLVKLWDLSWTGGSPGKGDPAAKERASLEGHKNWVTCLAFSHDGKLLASGSEDTTILLRDAASGKEIARLEGHEATVRCLAFSPDDKLLATGSFDRTVKVWDVAKRTEIAALEGHGDGVWAAAFSPDSTLLATGSADSTIRLWNIFARREGVQLEERAVLKGHGDWVSSLSFAPDGVHLASGSFDRTGKLWNALSHRERGTLAKQKSPVWCVRFSPDGRKLYLGTGSQTGEEETLLIWDMKPSKARIRVF